MGTKRTEEQRRAVQSVLYWALKHFELAFINRSKVQFNEPMQNMTLSADLALFNFSDTFRTAQSRIYFVMPFLLFCFRILNKTDKHVRIIERFKCKEKRGSSDRDANHSCVNTDCLHIHPHICLLLLPLQCWSSGCAPATITSQHFSNPIEPRRASSGFAQFSLFHHPHPNIPGLDFTPF